MPYYAHSGKDDSAARSDWQLLGDHLLAVAKGAEQRASAIEILGRSLGPAAHAAGLFHDLGKYRPGFKQKIEGIPVSDKKTTYHKQAGAAKAWNEKNFGVAFAIAGHHGGLPDLGSAQKAEKCDAGSTAVAGLWAEAVADCPALATFGWPRTEVRDNLLFDLETRILFSCLVDADWADTSEHDRRVKKWPEEPEPPKLSKEIAEAWLANVLKKIGEKASECKTAAVRQVRDEILQAALKTASESPPGFFTLAVPTGGGKTLSGLAFALKHAAEYGLRRIIYVAPFLSILDQNARVIREALGVKREGLEVFEHHSLTDPFGDTEEGDEQREAQHAAATRRAENWDAPVVVTTNVQFLESLFSNEPGRCRKLHNIAHSVVLLDECQAIPNDLLAPTSAMLSHLTEQLGCTMVLATATQPAFDHPKLHARGSGLHNVRPIVRPELDLFARLRRVHITWPRPDEYRDWTDVARLMTEDGREGRRAALCVVNTRRAARELFQLVREKCLQDAESPQMESRRDAAYHLSTWMCPAHRLKVLDTVRARLDSGLPCYLVSTQLIEAGVDVDFPMVLREMAPLEAIIQAAGRCNREGTLNGPDGSPEGRVVVFRSLAAKEEPRRYYPPDSWYEKGRDVLEKHLLSNNRQPSIDDPTVIDDYFHRLLNMGELDRGAIGSLREHWDFPEVAKKYRLIEEGGQPVVVTSWPEHVSEVVDLVDAVRDRPTRSRFRAARYQVNLRFPTDRQLSFVAEGPNGLSIWQGGYEPEMGLWDELLAEQTAY